MIRLKVITFNMQFGKVWDAKEPDKASINILKSIKAIKRENADIILLQEVEQFNAEHSQMEPPQNYNALKASMKGYDSYFSYPLYNKDELPFGYGLAIFSRSPLLKKVKIDLPADDIQFEFGNKLHHLTERLLIGATCIFGGKKINIFNTHLQAFFMLNKSSDHYPGQRETVIKSVTQSKAPTLLGGDFNSAPEESMLDFFESRGFRTAQWDKITWKRRPYTLDHIFYTKAFSLEKCVVRRTLSSDHNIVSAEFIL